MPVENKALYPVESILLTNRGCRGGDATGVPPEKISFPQALTAVTDTVTAGFPPSGS